MSEDKSTVSTGESETVPMLDAPARRRAEKRLHSVVGMLLAAFILAQLNYLAFRHFTTWDLTSDSRYTLSERSVVLLSELESPLSITVLLSEGEPQLEDLRQLLDRYAAESDRLRVRFIDPHREPTEARQIADAENIQLSANGEGQTLSEVAVVIRLGATSQKIMREDLLQVTESSNVNVLAERAISGAILALVEGHETLVCATTGRGEWSLTGGQRALVFLRDELARENTTVQSLNTLTDIPAECDAVFVLGPQRAVSPEEGASLVSYAESGGRVLLALDPIIERGRVAPSGFEEALALVGVNVDETIYLEPEPNLRIGSDPTDRLLVLPQPHAITMPALQRGGPFVVSLARTVRGEGEDVVPLFEGSALSFGESDLEQLLRDAELVPGDDDVPGPVTLGVVREFQVDLPAHEHGEAEEEASDSDEESPDSHAELHGSENVSTTPGRLVVIGDSDWLSDAFTSGGSFSNFDVARAVVAYLTERDVLLSIPVRRNSLRAVVMSQEDLSSVWRRVVIYLPAAVLLFGIAVLWSRRQ